ncbi:ComEA family DNA-binding protein [Streptomyces fungicidicus]|uniref:ComEA family DNA-binding protein n=2 Tax=Streptomyces fungicidicus TaxID=68203 RepID=UPI0033DCB422
MALRSRSRTATATSGPGRAPDSDGRARHRRPAGSRVRDRTAAADELRRRAESLFDDQDDTARAGSGRLPPSWARTGTHRRVRSGPPGTGERPVVAGHASVSAGGRAAHRAVAVEGARVVDRVGVTGRPASAGRSVGPGPGAGPGRGVAVDRWAAGRGLPAGGRPPERHGGGDDAVDDGAAREHPGGPGEVSGRRRLGPALRDRLPMWVQTRCGLERRSVIALSALLVLAVGFAVQHFWAGRTEPVRAPEVVRAAAPHGERAGDGKEARSAAPTGGPAAAAEIVVDVSGKVRDPGIHRLPAGSRVEDALRAAGGARPGTSTDGLNRARFLVDGEQVVVGGPAPPPPAPGGGPGTAAGAGPTAPVSLSTATLDQLDALPGVGPVLAQHILDHRTRNGGFRSVDELREVNGIGDRRFADLRDLVRP